MWPFLVEPNVGDIQARAPTCRNLRTVAKALKRGFSVARDSQFIQSNVRKPFQVHSSSCRPCDRQSRWFQTRGTRGSWQSQGLSRVLIMLIMTDLAALRGGTGASSARYGGATLMLKRRLLLERWWHFRSLQGRLRINNSQRWRSRAQSHNFVLRAKGNQVCFQQDSRSRWKSLFFMSSLCQIRSSLCLFFVYPSEPGACLRRSPHKTTSNKAFFEIFYKLGHWFRPYSFEDGPVVYSANAFDSRLRGE